MTKSFSNDSDNSDEYNYSTNYNKYNDSYEAFNNVKPDYELTIKFLKTHPPQYNYRNPKPINLHSIFMISLGSKLPNKDRQMIYQKLPLIGSDEMLKNLQSSVKPIYSEILNHIKKNVQISYNYNQKVLDEIINSILLTHKNQKLHKDIIKKKISQALFKSIRSTTSYDVKIINNFIDTNNKINLDKIDMDKLFKRMKKNHKEMQQQIINQILFSPIISKKNIAIAVYRVKPPHIVKKNIMQFASEIANLKLDPLKSTIRLDSEVYIRKYTTYANNEIEKIIKSNIDEIVQKQISRLEQENKLSTSVSSNNKNENKNKNKNKNKLKSMLSIDIGPTQQILIGTTLLLFSIMVVFLIGKS